MNGVWHGWDPEAAEKWALESASETHKDDGEAESVGDHDDDANSDSDQKKQGAGGDDLVDELKAAVERECDGASQQSSPSHAGASRLDEEQPSPRVPMPEAFAEHPEAFC